VNSILAASLLILTLARPAEEPAWRAVPIPDSWRQSPGRQNGYYWYRCRVRVPERWRERPLTLYVEPVDDAREVYFNGRLVGAAGTFPPNYRSGLGEPSLHQITEELARFGGLNTVAVRVHYSDGRTNFRVARRSKARGPL